MNNDDLTLGGSTSESRERPTSSMTPSDAISQGIGSNSRDPNAEIRHARIPLGQGLNLDIDESLLDRKNFYYHFFADMPDKPGRLSQVKAAGYAHATDNENNHITRPCGGGIFYLMKLPMKDRQADLLLKKQKVRATMDQETVLGANEYAPNPNTLEGEGGQSAVHRDSSDNPYG